MFLIQDKCLVYYSNEIREVIGALNFELLIVCDWSGSNRNVRFDPQLTYQWKITTKYPLCVLNLREPLIDTLSRISLKKRQIR